MRCNEWQERLEDFLENRLEGAEAAAVQLHVDGCVDCQASVVQDRALRRALLEDQDAELSADFEQTFFKRLDAERAETSWLTGVLASLRMRLLVPVFASVAVIGVSVVAVTQMTKRHEPQQFIVENQEMLAELDVVENLDAVEDFEAIRHLDQLVKAE